MGCGTQTEALLSPSCFAFLHFQTDSLKIVFYIGRVSSEIPFQTLSLINSCQKWLSNLPPWCNFRGPQNLKKVAISRRFSICKESDDFLCIPCPVEPGQTSSSNNRSQHIGRLFCDNRKGGGFGPAASSHFMECFMDMFTVESPFCALTTFWGRVFSLGVQVATRL